MNLFGKCPYVTAQKVLCGKWSIYLLHLLSGKVVRFNELQRMMPEHITHTSLSRQLKRLEADGLIIRTEYNQVPPRVEYSLSDMGNRFLPVLDELEKWGDAYIAQLKAKT